MPLILSTDVGRPLTPAEIDQNNLFLADLSASQTETSTVNAISAAASASQAVSAADTSAVDAAADAVSNVTAILSSAQSTTTSAATNAANSALSASNSAASANSAAAAVLALSETVAEVVDALEQTTDGVTQTFISGVGFTANVTAQLTLNSVPAKPNTVEVYFDGTYQQTNQYSITGATITFTSPIPDGVDRVEVRYFVPGTIFSQEVLDAATQVQTALAQVQAGKKDEFLAATHFTAGTTTQITLTGIPARPNLLTIFFDGIYQQKDQWSLAGAVITFTSAIPSGVKRIEALYDVAGTAFSQEIQDAANQVQAILVDMQDSKKDVFAVGVDFTADATTQLTLSYTPATANYVDVWFDSAYQQTNAWSVSGAVITFTEPIPAGVSRVEVKYRIPGPVFTQELLDAAAAVGPVQSASIAINDMLNRADPAKGISEAGRAVITINSVYELRSAKKLSDLTYYVRGFYPNTTYGGGMFRYDPTKPKTAHNGGTIISPTVPWDGTKTSIANYLSATGETDPVGLGCFVRDHGFSVFVSWFGAVGDAARPTAGAPDGAVSGTNDTVAINACRNYIQTVAFQPNLYVGFWGGFELCFEPNKCYYVKGHNPLGSTRSRDVNPGTNQRQSWRINGNGALIVWEVETENDAFIEAYEAFTTQYYHDFSVIVAKAVNKMGTFFSNTAASGRNATQRHKFERVEVYHAMPSSTTHGLKYMFYYTGDNLGDRLITEQCAFAQAHTMFYSENGEAVQQGFKSTTFASYLDNGIFFHLRRHGSTFNFGAGCGFLVKGNNQTLFKTQYMSGSEGGSNGGNIMMDVSGCRLECQDGQLQTLANCDFGMLELKGVTMAAGGLPSVNSVAVITRKTGAVKLVNSHVYGKLVVGQQDATNIVKRSYGIKLVDCMFSNDVGKSMYMEDATGTLIAYKDAVVGNYLTPSIVIEGTSTKTANWQGLASDTSSYVFDATYLGNLEYNTIPHGNRLVVGRYRGSSGYYYLDNRDYVVLPPFTTITSIRISHAAISTSVMDTVKVKVGSAVITYNPTNNVAARNLEILPNGQVIIISDDDKAQRTIATEVLLGSTPWSNPSFIAFLEIQYRSAVGKMEITTTVDGNGIRLTRLA